MQPTSLLLAILTAVVPFATALPQLTIQPVGGETVCMHDTGITLYDGQYARWQEIVDCVNNNLNPDADGVVTVPGTGSIQVCQTETSWVSLSLYSPQLIGSVGIRKHQIACTLFGLTATCTGHPSERRDLLQATSHLCYDTNVRVMIVGKNAI